MANGIMSLASLKHHPAPAGVVCMLAWCPRQESNLDHKLRKLAFYPLNYEGSQNSFTSIGGVLVFSKGGYCSLSSLDNASEVGSSSRDKSSVT